MINNAKFNVTFKIDDNFKSDKFVKMRMKLCHDGKNPNKTFFKAETLEEKKESLANSPILAHIFKDENGQLTIGEHDMKIEPDAFNDDKFRLIYLEKPVGVIPENNNFEIVEEDGKKYVYVDGYVWKDYSNYCLDILENYDEIKISMEVDIYAYSYNKNNDYYEIEDFIYKGVTFLNEKYETGMEKARASIETFSKNEDSMTELKKIMQELSLALNNYNSTMKGEKEKMNTERIEEILKEYNLTRDSLTFEITDDMTEEGFKSELDKMCQKTQENENTDNAKDETEDSDNSTETDGDETSDTTDENTDNTSEIDSSEATQEFVANAEIPVEKRTFMLASDKLEKLRTLISDEWITDDSGECIASAYYYIMDYDDSFAYYSKYSWNINDGNSKTYVRVKYNESDGKITSVGEPVEVFQSYLTSEERNELKKIQSNYSALSEEVETLKQYKANIEKAERDAEINEIFSMFDAELENTEEYSALKDNNADMSIDEIKTKCFALIGMKKFSAAKTNHKDKKIISFSLNDNTDNTQESKGKYDEIFEKYNGREVN